MHDAPATPDVTDAPDALSGHLWLQEHVDGTTLRFQVRDAAPIRFGDDTRTFTAADCPRELRYAVHEVERRLDRAALRQAVEDVETITFVGTATHRQTMAYDWHRLPGFLGTDVWDNDTDEFLPPDRAEQVFESLGLAPVNALVKEVRADDFHPDRYDFPDSAWRDGRVAGVLARDKTGGRAILRNSSVGEAEVEPALTVDHELAADEFARIFAEELATDALYRRVADAIEADDARTRTFDAVQEAILDSIYREHTPSFNDVTVDHDEFRRAVAARTSEFVGNGG